MKKYLIPLTVLLVCAFIITGCGTSSSTTPVASTTAAAVTTTQAATSKPVPTTVAVTTSAATQPVSTTAVATKPAATTSANYGGIIRYIQSAGPGTPLSPWEATGGVIATLHYVLEPPLREDFGGKLVGRVAESWDINAKDNPPNIVFRLRKGLKFSDGTDCNAQAVKWAFEKSKAGGMTAGTTNFWSAFDVIDDTTLKVSFTMWRNTFPRGFSENVAMISSPTALEKNGLDWVRTNMVGSGPFLQSLYQRDVTFKAKKNPNYWDKGFPYLDEIQNLFVADMLTRDALFKSGGAEMMDISPQQASAYQSAEYNLITQAGGATVLVPDSMNADSPWSNVKVRQAAEYAIDKDSLARTFGYGYYKAAYQLVSPSSMAWDPNFKGERKFDIAKAKQLLTEAGYSAGFKTKIIAGPPGVNKDIIVALQSYLGKVGIQCDLEFPEAASYQGFASGTWKNALLYNALMEWPNPNTALNFFMGVPTSWFQSLKKPDGWKDLLTASITSPDVDPVLVQKAHNALYEDNTMITLFYGANIWVEKANVRDSGHGKRGNTGYWNPQYAWLSK